MRCLCHLLHVGRCVLRAPGGPVDLDRHPAGGGPRFDQFERSVLAGVGEQPRALADDHGTDEKVELVDEVGCFATTESFPWAMETGAPSMVIGSITSIQTPRIKKSSVSSTVPVVLNPLLLGGLGSSSRPTLTLLAAAPNSVESSPSSLSEFATLPAPSQTPSGLTLPLSCTSGRHQYR
jgi:hypothetical protein